MNLKYRRSTNFGIKLILQYEDLCIEIQLIIQNIFVFSDLSRRFMNSLPPTQAREQQEIEGELGWVEND